MGSGTSKSKHTDRQRHSNASHSRKQLNTNNNNYSSLSDKLGSSNGLSKGSVTRIGLAGKRGTSSSSLDASTDSLSLKITSDDMSDSGISSLSETPHSSRSDLSAKYGSAVTVKREVNFSLSLCSEYTWCSKLPVLGQGLVMFDIIRNTPFKIVVRNENCLDCLTLHVNQDGASFSLKLNDHVQNLAEVTGKKAGFRANSYVSYWLSYDRVHKSLKYGQGYMMDEAVLLSYQFTSSGDEEYDKKIVEFFKPNAARFVEFYDVVCNKQVMKLYEEVIQYKYPDYKQKEQKAPKDILGDIFDVKKSMHFNKNPLITNRPPVILDSSRSSLIHLDKGNYTFSSSLPPAVKELYDNVKVVEFDSVKNGSVRLSDAVRYSIQTPGCLLYEKLKSKAQGFGTKPNPNLTYLRITLGPTFGKSPGIPYVLEIWPAGHYSPVHNHGDSSAVIKVLFGQIHIRIFNKFTRTLEGKEEAPQKLSEFDGSKGDFVWMDRNWYQTHQLINTSDDFCATLQCYRYDDVDNRYWPFFDYINDKKCVAEFLPNTDFTYSQMQETVFNEYKA